MTVYFSFGLLQGDCAKVSSISDKRDWRAVRNALSVIEFSETDVEVRDERTRRHFQNVCVSFMTPLLLDVKQSLFGIIASVLHLGNIRFEADVRGYASLNNNQETHWVSKVT